ncbi:VOC family protein [Bradyrhizobium sp.]|uniref:VOC family protein n=1 Tax=Bradyrhizobium sp. TaxID=376 RepID=UPI0039E6B530
MKQLTFGQPVGGIVQAAYTVDDIESAMKRYVDALGIGPWFVSGPFVPAKGFYRGEPTDMSLTLAVAFTGHMMIELIEQHDSKPSVYQETIKVKGHGFHHWAICSKDFDADVARYEAAGYPVVFSDVSPRGVRIVYVDTSRDLPGMLEIIETTDALESIYHSYFAAAQDWDGKDPIRRWSLKTGVTT